jgi:hypothetical protein
LQDGTPLEGGAYVSNEWFDAHGLTLSASGGFSDMPRLFNTSDVGDDIVGDPDLGSPNKKCDPSGPGVGVGGEPGQPGENCVPQGNVLIIQDEDTDQPDDNVDGGTITFDFAETVDFVYDIGLMDVDYEGAIAVLHKDEDGKDVTTIVDIDLFGDNAVQTVPINVANVSQLKLILSRSGAVTYLAFCQASPKTTTPPTPQTQPSSSTQVPTTSPSSLRVPTSKPEPAMSTPPSVTEMPSPEPPSAKLPPPEMQANHKKIHGDHVGRRLRLA